MSGSRFSALRSVDPAFTPLPRGTEVTTRIARALPDRLLPMGAVGRVSHGDHLRVFVDIVGVGMLEFAREELALRKAGQARYATRRHDAWSALSATIVLRATVGSRAWGFYNLLRLLYLAQDWLVTGAPVFEATGARRERLLAIKRSQVSLAEVLAEAEALLPGLEEARRSTKLPPHPEVGRAERLLRKVRVAVARRSVLGDPGPWGQAAPPAPEAAWDGSK